MNGLHELSNIYDLQLLCSTDAVECHFDVKVGEISRRWQFCDMKNATKYLVGSLGVLMT